MPDPTTNHGIIISGGTNSSSNYATGAGAVQSTATAATPDTDALRQVQALLADLRAGLHTEPDPDLREDIADALDRVEQHVATPGTPDEATWRERLTPIARAADRLTTRATQLAQPLAQLATALTLLAGLAH